jgi:hypothetical protein
MRQIVRCSQCGEGFSHIVENLPACGCGVIIIQFNVKSLILLGKVAFETQEVCSILSDLVNMTAIYIHHSFPSDTQIHSSDTFIHILLILCIDISHNVGIIRVCHNSTSHLLSFRDKGMMKVCPNEGSIRRRKSSQSGVALYLSCLHVIDVCIYCELLYICCILPVFRIRFLLIK